MTNCILWDDSRSRERNLTRLCAIVALAGLALPAVRARAADADTSAEQQGPMQEVVVTATRREESLSHVPLSVTALTQDTMDAKGIKDIQDIVRFTPGVGIDTAGTNAISIRGISSSAGAGTTGIYIDDTPIQMRDVGFNPDETLPKTFDLERVEVLRGPQGTLFGSGSEGGTVRYILTQPSLTKSSTYVRSEIADTAYGEPSYEIGAAHGQPIIDGVLGVRASAWYRYDGGWIDRVDPSTALVTERHANHGETLVLRLAAVWQPASALTVTPSIFYQNLKKHDESTYWPAYSDPPNGHFYNATPERIPVADEFYLPSLKIQWDFGSSVLLSNTSYYHRKEFTGYQGTVYDLGFFQLTGWPSNPLFGGLGCEASGDPTQCPWYPLIDGNGIHLPPGFSTYSTPNVVTNSQQSYVQEVRWQSTDPAARWRWTVGAFWQLAKEGSIEELKDPQIDAFFNAIYGQTATSLFGPYYSCPDNSAYNAIPACDIYYKASTTFDHQIAAFGEVSYALTERLRLTVGERIARTSFSITSYADGLENFGPLGPRSASTQETPNTPKVSLAWQVDPNNLYYASYSTGFRVGGGNPPLPTYCAPDATNLGLANGQAPATYKSDTTENYEIGSKNVIGGALRIATSLYYITWNDIQQSVYVAGSCGLQFVDNLGQAVAKGFDVQAELAVGPMLFEVAAGYTDARFKKDATLDPSNPPLVRSGDAIAGNAAINFAPGLNPPWTVSLGAEYRFKPLQHDAFVRLDWEYESMNPWPSPLQDPGTSQYNPATYTLGGQKFASLRAGVNLGDWLVSAFIDNLFDSKATTNYALSQADTYNPVYSPTVQENRFTFRPRTAGVTVTLHLNH